MDFSKTEYLKHINRILNSNKNVLFKYILIHFNTF